MKLGSSSENEGSPLAYQTNVVREHSAESILDEVTTTVAQLWDQGEDDRPGDCLRDDAIYGGQMRKLQPRHGALPPPLGDHATVHSTAPVALAILNRA